MKKIRNIRGKDVFIIGGDLNLGKIKDMLIDTSTLQMRLSKKSKLAVFMNFAYSKIK